VDQDAGAGSQAHSPNLALALIDGPLTRPLIDGRVTVAGVALDAFAVEPSDLFFRQLHHAEFDCSELSLASLSIKYARGDRTWWALPVFTSRNFYHTLLLVRRDSGIATPADLRGKRVGVPEYQQTAAVWARGVLAEDFGVQPWDIEWHMERLPTMSHAYSTGSGAPKDVVLHHIPASTSIMEMLAEGSLDATLFYFGPTKLDRSVMNDAAATAIVPLFPDRSLEGRRFFARRGYVPINHGMVIRRSLVEAHEWLPRNICAAMAAAKLLARQDAAAFLAPYLNSGLLPADVSETIEEDLMGYGLAKNREALETLMRYLHSQGLTDRQISPDELFAPLCD
jgi:4,5-dihydroxyphthalate decarboxylase